MKHIREYIRNVLLESSMKPVAGLKNEGLALWHTAIENEHYMLLYDFEDLADNTRYVKSQITKQYGWRGEDMFRSETSNLLINSSIAGMIIKPSRYPCNGAHTVEVAVGWKGYGPAIYDLAMSISPNGLIADRGDVSSKAQGVWEYYFKNKRPDIEIKLLDHWKQQWTPSDSDDCDSSANQRGKYDFGVVLSRNDWKKDPMNYSYNTDYALGHFKELVSIHEKRINEELPELKEAFQNVGLHEEVIWLFYEHVKTKRRDL